VIGKAQLFTLCLAALMATAAAGQEAVARYRIENGAIAASLTGVPGDAARGRAIVVNRQTGLCLLCHAGPFPEERFQGTVGPDLRGVGSRLSAGEIRLRLVDSSAVNPATVMPPYHRIDGLERVAPAWRGKPAFDAQQIEDVVALLAGLKAP